METSKTKVEAARSPAPHVSVSQSEEDFRDLAERPGDGSDQR